MAPSDRRMPEQPGRAVRVSASESLVEVDPVCGDAETGEDLALGGEVLQDG
jgi:hypothetical protein